MVILTYNEEDNLAGCLASCQWCDDVHVLDSGSTDNTLKIAEAANTPVHANAFEDFAQQRNWATDNIDCKHDWVFHLDADERFTPEGVAELKKLLATNPPVDGFHAPHKMMLAGTWLKRSEGYPVYQARLIHKKRFRYVASGHGQREAPGSQMGTLTEPYLHEAYRRGPEDWLARHNAHSTKEAQAILSGEGLTFKFGDLFSTNRTTRRRALKALTFRFPGRPWLRWLSIIVINRGFLDGKAAFLYANLHRLYDQMTFMKVKWARLENH